jgi:hypothetical protein
MLISVETVEYFDTRIILSSFCATSLPKRLSTPSVELKAFVAEQSLNQVWKLFP